MKIRNKIKYRDCDIRIGILTDEQIIKLLYERLNESNKILEKIKGLVTSSFGCKDETDFNSEILNPLWQVYNNEDL